MFASSFLLHENCMGILFLQLQTAGAHKDSRRKLQDTKEHLFMKVTIITILETKTEEIVKFILFRSTVKPYMFI